MVVRPTFFKFCFWRALVTNIVKCSKLKYFSVRDDQDEKFVANIKLVITLKKSSYTS